MNLSRPTVFLDRDGTLIEEVGYIKDIKDIKFIGKAVESIKKLNEHNILVILISNQSGIARGYFKETDVENINNRIKELLTEKDAYLDGIYYCPHHPDGIVKEFSKDCDCRKPKAGLIYQALNDFQEIDLKKAYVIGDKATDIELARNVGCKGILLKTGYGSEVIQGKYQNYTEPDYIADNIEGSVEWILKKLKDAIINK
ncbi:MAG: HAD family hydrolase [bacterium]